MTQHKYTVWISDEFHDEFYEFLMEKWNIGEIPDYYFEGSSEEE